MLKTSNIYTDNMIFQHDKEIFIRGYYDGSYPIWVQILENGCKIAENTTYASNCIWEICFSPLGIKKNIEIEISANDEKITLKNVACGEVWLMSGQSNIECGFDYCSGAEHYLDIIGNYDIRFLDIEQDISFEKQAELKNARWLKLNKNSALTLSTVSCIFACRLAEKLDIPIGLVKNYRGGNSVITFLSEENIRNSGYDFLTEQFLKGKNELKSAWSMIPSGFYNAMTAPVEAFSYRGILWYQGETDSAYLRPDIYKKLMKSLLYQWRTNLHDESLPVIVVQLCPFEADPFDFKVIRQFQLDLSLEDEFIHLVTTSDCGPTGADGETPIHPKYKTPIGERCADAALGAVYNFPGEWSGPIISSAEKQDSRIILKFDHTGSGLKSDSPVNFECFAGNFFFSEWLEGKISSENTITIENAKDIHTVRYGYINMTSAKTLGITLTNNTNIPASPFVITV